MSELQQTEKWIIQNHCPDMVYCQLTFTLHIMKQIKEKGLPSRMIYREFYPFYIAQGDAELYEEERAQEKEFALMRSYYPDMARQIQEKAQEQCQLMDYEGSRLYDEYPDRFMLYHLCSIIRDEVMPDAAAQAIAGSFLDDLIEVLVYQEISRRRCRRKRCRRRF